jgi:hypothetical protein
MTFPSTASTPQLVVPSTNIQYILGFTAGTYPATSQTTTYSVLSSFTPQVTPIESLILTCNLVNNLYSLPRSLFYAVAPTGISFGSLFTVSPAAFSWIDVQDGMYTEISIQFCDQNATPIVINDSNLVVQLNIKNKSEQS